MYIFDFVRKSRVRLGLKQKQLADKAGVSIYVVKRIEKDEPYNPPAIKVSKIAKALDVDWNYLNDYCTWP